ncbi:MAG: serine/threonine-protein kinase [Planctomycetaceae bacterium]
MTVIAEPTSPACPRCGNALPGDAPSGLCPRCLLSDGFGDQSEGDFRLRTGQPGPRFVPPTIEELAVEFPHLEFLQLLGSGGMGAVYLAKQIRLDRRVAVKILPPDLADDGAFAERFLREARALARLGHPNIVGVYDFGQTPGGLFYFLMEYIDGPTLRQVVVNRTAEPKQALEIVQQVCDALQFAHDKGVVHRDIKPENILLDGHGRVKIADFGLAKLLGLAEPSSPAAGSLTGTRQAMGTPHYMAPEQIAGSRSVDHRADIYSLGVVFYELLTGELPVGRFAPPSKKVQIDVRLDEVVLRSLEAEPAQRYQRASDVKTDVETISSVPPRRHGDPFPAAMRFVRDASAGTGRAVRSVLEPSRSGELSKKAIAALVWAAAVPLALLCIVLFELVESNRDLDVLEVLFATIGFVLALPAITAPIGTTVLGIAAVREVRRSNGSVTGLVPGLAAALAFPLLILDALLFLLLSLLFVGPTDAITGSDDFTFIPVLLAGIPLVLWLDVRLTRAAWRKATAGLPPELIERELSIIPASVLRAVHAVGDWCEQMGLSPGLLFGRPRPAAEPSEPADDVPAAHFAVASAPSSPRTSIKAIVGAIWAVLALGVAVAVIAGGTVSVRPVATDSPPAPVWVIIIPLAILVVGVLVPAPFVVTILGWSAVSDIRQSSGRLIGLPLAVLDGLCFPLLLLDAVVAVPVTAGLVWIAYEGFSVDQHDYGPLHVAVIGLIVLGIVVAIDAVIAFIVWRRVKASMRPTAADRPETPPPAEPESWIEPVASRRHRDLVMAGVAITIAVLLIGLQLLYESGFPGRRSNESATVDYDYAAPATVAPTSGGGMAWPAGAITEEDRNRGWRMVPDGPEVLPQWMGGMFGPEYGMAAEDWSILKQIDAALQDVYADYERVLDERTTATFDGEAAVFNVEPFPEELDRLENEFWSRVDPLLTLERQKVMRYNFPLRYDAKHPQAGQYDNFVMPIGHGRGTATIRIERTGQWYRWEVALHNLQTGNDSPELPQYLRRFQHQFERLMSLRKDGLAFDPQRLPLVAPQPAGTASPVAWPSGLPSGFGGMGMMPSSDMGMMSGSTSMIPMPGMEAMGDTPGYSEMGAMPGFGMDMYGGMSGQPAGTDDERPLPDRLQRWGLDPKAVAAVVNAVNEIEQDYHAVLTEHTQVDVKGTSVTFTTNPFPEQIDRLERRFWEQVDPLLNVEQQRMLRKSFPVGEPWYPTRDAARGPFGSGVGRMGSGFNQHSSTKPGLLMIGHGVTRLSIARVGQWYRWQLEGGELGESMHTGPPQETPALPPWLRHFQERYDELSHRLRSGN